MQNAVLSTVTLTAKAVFGAIDSTYSAFTLNAGSSLQSNAGTTRPMIGRVGGACIFGYEGNDPHDEANSRRSRTPLFHY